MAHFVGAVEMACGALLIVGLLTRLAAVPLLIDILIAIATLCADEVCPVFLGRARRFRWALPDPAGAGETEPERLQAFRDVRDELRRRLGAIFERAR